MNRTMFVVLGFFLFTAQSLAQVTTFPYAEGFDADTTALPFGWSASGFAINLSSTSSRSPKVCVMATGNMLIKQLTSATFSFAGKTPDKLMFYERRSSTAAGFRLEVRASTDGVTFPLLVARFDTTTSTSNYVKRMVDLRTSGLVNQPLVRFRWQLHSDSTNNTGTLRIDDVSLTVLVANDVAASRLSVQPATPRSNDNIELTAVIKNLGTQTAATVSAKFFLDADGNGVAESFEQFDGAAIPSIASGDSAVVTALHAPLRPGTHRFFALASLAADEVPTNDTASVAVQVGFLAGSLLVNEIMYAPVGDEPEWIEVLNPTADTLNLKNWRMSDNNVSSKSLITSSDVLIPPYGFAIVTKDSGFNQIHTGISISVIVTSFAALNNSTPDDVVLYDPLLSTIDSVSYLPGWGGQNGKSLERIDWESTSTLQSNWGSSVDSAGSTPGHANSNVRLEYDLVLSRAGFSFAEENGALVPKLSAVVINAGKKALNDFAIRFYADTNRNNIGEAAELLDNTTIQNILQPHDSTAVEYVWHSPPSGATTIIVSLIHPNDQRLRNNAALFLFRRSFAPRSLVINEIMYDPLDGQNEWMELFNRSNAPVDVAQWKFSDRPTISGSVNEFVIAASPLLVQPNEFAVIAADTSFFKLFPHLTTAPGVHILVLNKSGGFGWNSDGDAIVLRDLTGTTIDSVGYSPSWHHPNVTDTRGRSLERINPNLDSNDPRNWSTCTVNVGGTPGTSNSINAVTAVSDASLSFSPNPFSPDGDGFEDFCVIGYKIPTSSSFITMRIFDIRGRLVRRLMNAEFAGSSGQVIWDGMDDERQRVRIGPYIVLMEATDTRTGDVFRAKAVVVVATRL